MTISRCKDRLESVKLTNDGHAEVWSVEYLVACGLYLLSNVGWAVHQGPDLFHREAKRGVSMALESQRISRGGDKVVDFHQPMTQSRLCTHLTMLAVLIQKLFLS